ncbi:MAG: nucleoside triphosphate pyrophosphohydrolase [Gammaproteobacteria bacterium]
MSHNIDNLLSIMAQLRDPETGCPWDQEQDYKSLTRYTLEEAYEVIDVIENDQLNELPDELGDLLFQIVFYSQLGREQGKFDFTDVVDAISDKLIRRHPHVFADEQVNDAEDQTRAWEKHKAAERKEKAAEHKHNLLDGISRALPASTRAIKLQKRAAQVNFDWPDTKGVVEKLHEEIAELEQAQQAGDKPHIAEELGDLLFTCINLVRHFGEDPESVLRACNTRFEQRFKHMEDLLAQQGGIKNVERAKLEWAWQQAKKSK